MRKLLTLVPHPIFWVIALLIVLVTAAYWNVRTETKSEWQEYQGQARARGVKFTFAEILPAPIPDEVNFGTIPMFQALFRPDAAGEKKQQPFQFPPGKKPSLTNWLNGQSIDWSEWRHYFLQAKYLTATTESAPADVLQALDHYQDEIKEWRAAEGLTQCQFPVQWQDGISARLPHCGVLRNAAEVFTLRMIAHAALGEREEALRDFRSAFKAIEAAASDRALFPSHVALSAFSMVRTGIQEGIADRVWDDAALGEIASKLRELRWFALLSNSLDLERVAFCSFTDEMLSKDPLERAKILNHRGLDLDNKEAFVASFFFDERFYRSNELRTSKYLDEIQEQIDQQHQRIDSAKPTPSGPKKHAGPFEKSNNFLFYLVTPVLSEVTERFAETVASSRQGEIACALERYRLKHGNYPADLGALIPEYFTQLPEDPYDQQPMRYRLKDEGGFQLYAVGPDGVDNHGALDPKLSESKQRDVVWVALPNRQAIPSPSTNP